MYISVLMKKQIDNYKNLKKMILHNQNLVDELRSAFDTASKRIWIAVPFIGQWKSVERILGRNWMMEKDIDFRLITDIYGGSLSEDTYLVLREFAKMRSLSGLHAKLYIIDDFILLTSANLTGTAFSKRFEIGLKKILAKLIHFCYLALNQCDTDYRNMQ